jgi:DNA polymerase-3 subunit alpha
VGDQRQVADYSFNRSHAACYALISYRTAWLKANYPAEYMAALISSVMSTKDKVPFFVNQTEAMGIEILPPDVNESDHQFVVFEGSIRFGLDAVKGVGYSAVEAIKRARTEGGPFTSLWDFCERVDCRTVNRKSIEALIKCGAFGSTGASRKGMLSVLEAAQGSGAKAQLDAQIGQGSIFDLGGGDEAAGAGASPFGRPSHPPIPTEEFERGELLAAEKESIGLFITEHPLKPVREALRAKADTTCAEVPDRRDNEWVKLGGMITECRKIKTRSGSTLMFATLDDLDGTVELMLFEKSIVANEAALVCDEIVLVKGRVEKKEGGKVVVLAQDVAAFKPSEAEIARADAHAAERAAVVPRALTLRLDATQLPASAIDDLRRLLEDYPGDCEVVLEMVTRAGPRRLRLGEGYRVAARNAGLKAELSRLLGPALPAPAVVVEETAVDVEPEPVGAVA